MLGLYKPTGFKDSPSKENKFIVNWESLNKYFLINSLFELFSSFSLLSSFNFVFDSFEFLTSSFLFFIFLIDGIFSSFNSLKDKCL